MITTFQKKIKNKTAKSNYSNTKVKARKLLTNISYRRYKQKNFNNASFITDILSFLVQNFTPINLDRKLDNENEKFFIKFLWDECLPHGFTRFICMGENYNVLSNPKLTHQKANGIVKKFIKENTNNINLLKFKIEKKTLKSSSMSIHCCILKFIIGSTILEFKIKAISILLSQFGEQENKTEQSVQRLLTNYQHLQNNLW